MRKNVELMIKLNKEFKDNRKYLGYQIKAIIGKVIEEINSKPQASPCPNTKCKKGWVTDLITKGKYPCKVCSGTGKARSYNSSSKKDCFNPSCSKRMMNNICINGNKFCGIRLSSPS